MKGLSLLFLLIALPAVSAGDDIIVSSDNVETKIVGGTDAKVGRFNYATLGLFSLESKLLYACHGTLIAPNVVMSSAYCEATLPSSEIYIGLYDKDRTIVPLISFDNQASCSQEKNFPWLFQRHL